MGKKVEPASVRKMVLSSKVTEEEKRKAKKIAHDIYKLNESDFIRMLVLKEIGHDDYNKMKGIVDVVFNTSPRKKFIKP